jgi:hypothetical protein
VQRFFGELRGREPAINRRVPLTRMIGSPVIHSIGTPRTNSLAASHQSGGASGDSSLLRRDA